MARAIDVVQVKAEIAAEKLAVIIENGSVLLKDMQSGEAVKIATLTTPNEPLTLEELREMDGEPAWWDDGDGSCWGIISVDSAGMWGGIPFFRGRWKEVNFEYNIEDRKMKIYRRPPEGEEDA